MRRVMMGVLLASTLAAPALAQGWQDHQGNQQDRAEVHHDRREARQDANEVRQDHREVNGDVRRGDYREAHQDARDLHQDRQDLRGDRQDLRGDRRDQHGDAREWHNGDNRGFANRGFDGNHGQWSNNWRNDRRYDWQGYRNANRSFYHGPRYYGPRGYSYHRYARGYRIAPFFYGRQYWISDPWAYRLPPAYGSYRWVRYYNDVLLIDVTNGLIADSINSFFW